MKKEYENKWGYIFIPVSIISKDSKTYKINLLFDTGASKTQISHSAAEFLGYTSKDASERVSTTTVAGRIEGYKLDLPELIVFGKTYKNFKINVFDIAYSEKRKDDIDGLLGMDIINQVKLLIDGPNRKIYKT